MQAMECRHGMAGKRRVLWVLADKRVHGPSACEHALVPHAHTIQAHARQTRSICAASHLRPSHHHSCLTKGTLKHTELPMPCTAPLSALGSRGELEAKTMGMPRGSAEWGCMEILREVQLIPEVFGSIMLGCEMHAMIERTQDMHG